MTPLGGALVGALDYYTFRKWVQKKSTSWNGAFWAAVSGALASIGGSLIGKVLSGKLRKFLWSHGKHAAYKMRRKLESFGFDWLGGVFWAAWNAATDAFYEVLARRS